MKIISIVTLLVLCLAGHAQELYVYTEPASNMPAKSISVKLNSKFLRGLHTDRIEQRYSPELMFGVGKKWMVHVAGSFSDMYLTNLRWESVKLYAKYRFLSNDDVHEHFRMAAFGEVSHSVNDPFYDDLSLDGDQSGVQGGLVATQLWNKLAVSSTVSYLHVTTERPKVNADLYAWDAFNYTASAGYLLFPRSYTNYKQTNVNLYAELLGQEILNRKLFYLDLAPAVQLIFNSNAKLNLGYRFQLNGNMHRMSKESFLVGFEYVFLNALSRK